MLAFCSILTSKFYRFIFVAGTNDGEPSLSLLMKSNKTATEALSSVLHLGDGDTTGNSIVDIVADLNSDDTLTH